MEIKNVTFIGLGVMGYNMAGHLKKNNFNTTVYNRTSAVADKWVNEFSGTSVSTPGQAASNADIVFLQVHKLQRKSAMDTITNNARAHGYSSVLIEACLTDGPIGSGSTVAMVRVANPSARLLGW